MVARLHRTLQHLDLFRSRPERFDAGESQEDYFDRCSCVSNSSDLALEHYLPMRLLMITDRSPSYQADLVEQYLQEID